MIEKQIYANRKSGIDLLRIIAMLCICIFHATQTFCSKFPTESTDSPVITALGNFGAVGNMLFIICSSYFLALKPKARADKAINILADATLISILFLIVYLLCGVQLGKSTILHQILPNIYNQNWFIPCYVIFYLLSPIVIKGLSSLTKETHFALCIVSLIVYGLLSLYDPLTPVGSHLLKFFYILNIVAFITWHVTPKSSLWNLVAFLIGTLIYILLSVLAKYLSRNVESIPSISFGSYYSPFLLFPLIFLFNLFRNMKFNNAFISYLSSCTLFVYIIHENALFRSITRKAYFSYAVDNFGIQYAVWFILLCGMVMFIAGFILSVIYNETLHKLTKKLSALIVNGIKRIINKLFSICVK